MPESSDADRAYAHAQELIAHALKTRATELNLRGGPHGEGALAALDRLPPELAEATALQSFTLRDTQVTDLTPLQSLTALQSLDLAGTPVTDLTPLQSLTALQYLYFTRTQVTDLTPLQSLTALQSLTLGDTRVTDLTPLQSLTALQSLNLWGTRVTDLTPLQSLTALQSLVLRNTRVTDFTPLQSLTALQSLNLRGTKVADLTPLQRLTALQRLDLSFTQVTDLRPIRDLPQMDGVGRTTDGFGITNDNGLFFKETEVTRRDPELARLSAIDDKAERTQATLAYLRGRADWPPLPEDPPEDRPSSSHTPQVDQVLRDRAAVLMRAAKTSQLTAFQFAAGLENEIQVFCRSFGYNALPEQLADLDALQAALSQIAHAQALTEDSLVLQLAEMEKRAISAEARIRDLESALAHFDMDDDLVNRMSRFDTDEGGINSPGWTAYRSTFGTSAAVVTVFCLVTAASTGIDYFLGDNDAVKAFKETAERIPHLWPGN